MILSYWWMHWFWITTFIYFVFSYNNEMTTSHSIALSVIESLNPPISNRTINIKTTTSTIVSSTVTTTISSVTIKPSIYTSNSSQNNTLNNHTIVTKFSKPSLKKLDFINMTSKLNLTQLYSNYNKDMAVINQNNSNTVDLGLNNSFSNAVINQTTAENLTYFGDDNNISNHSTILLNSERIGIDEYKNNSNSSNLSAAGITGITLGCVVIVGVICGVSYFLYRNRGFNRPQVLNDRCSNPDSSGYIDDASVRDNSEEMYSLDNDSFLNSLEAMTIQNYWTDTVKHTKL